MKTPLLLLVGLLFVLGIATVRAQSPIVPKGWIKLEELAHVEAPLQKQLDTGIAMLDTAWSMAMVKDAELFVVYISVYEKLSDPARAALRISPPCAPSGRGLDAEQYRLSYRVEVRRHGWTLYGCNMAQRRTLSEQGGRSFDESMVIMGKKNSPMATIYILCIKRI